MIPAVERRAEGGSAARQVVIALSFGAFLTSLDAGAVTATLPLIRGAFGATISSVHWVLTAELLVTSGLLLVFGRLGDTCGPRRVYQAGFGVFLLGCMLSSAAPSLAALIAFRALQGIGTAGLLANSPVLLARHVPLPRRGSGFGTKLSCLYLGLMAGPIAGGWLAGRFGWRAVFAMEAPAAVAGLLLAAVFLPRDPGTGSPARYDWAGACAWVLGLASLVWLAGRDRPRSGGWAVGAAVAAPVLAAWIAARRRAAEPLFSASCFRSRRFSACVLSLMIAFAASYTLTFALVFSLVEVRHASAWATGGALAAYALARASVAWWSGRWSDRVDARWLAIPGLLLFACSLVALSAMSQASGLSSLAALVAAGVGFGCFVPPNNTALMASVPPKRYGFAGGMLATARTVGMTSGVALGAAILSAGNGALAEHVRLAFLAAALLALAGAIVIAADGPLFGRIGAV